MQSQIRFPKEAELHSPGSPQALPQDPTDGRAEPAHYTEGETEARCGQSGVSSPGEEERDGLQLFTPAGLWSLSSLERKPEPCPVGFFITRILSSFHGNQLWAPGRKAAACGDCSDFPLPSPPLKPSGSSSRRPREGLPQSCAPVPKPQT